MEAGLTNLIINLISGGVGGNIAGALLKNINLGTLWNSITGVVGGGLGGWLLPMIAGAAPGMGGSIAGSGIGGIVLMAIVGYLKKSMAAKSA